jgi:hypothetical protein
MKARIECVATSLSVCALLRRIAQTGLLLALLAGVVPLGHAQIGSGWTQYTPTLTYDVPPNGQLRHTFSGGIHHFWVLKSDPSTFPGRDSGPRSEAHVHNDYSSGSRQFQADIKVEAGSNFVSLVQIFGTAATGHATSFMMWTHDNGFSHYGDPIFFKGVIGVYNRVNIIHTMRTDTVDVYVNGSKLVSFNDGGQHSHYNKFGVYGRPQMGAFNGAFFRNVMFFMKP